MNLNKKLILLVGCISAILHTSNAQEEVMDESIYNRATTFYIEATEQYEQKNYQLAVENFTRAIETNPNNSDYFFGRATSYYELKKYTEALSDINTAMNLEQNQPDYHYYAGNIHFKLKNFAEAASNYTKALSFIDNSLFTSINLNSVYYNRGMSWLSLNKYQEAKKDFLWLINDDAENPEATYYLAFSLMKLNQLPEACDYFQKAKNLGMTKASEYLQKMNCR